MSKIQSIALGYLTLGVMFASHAVAQNADDDLLGAGKWSAGPTAVALKQTRSGWTYGVCSTSKF